MEALTLLYDYGSRVFGTKKKFSLWLVTKNIALGNITPKNLLNNANGINLLKDELTRIEYGILA